MIVLITL